MSSYLSRHAKEVFSEAVQSLEALKKQLFCSDYIKNHVYAIWMLCNIAHFVRDATETVKIMQIEKMAYEKACFMYEKCKEKISDIEWKIDNGFCISKLKKKMKK